MQNGSRGRLPRCCLSNPLAKGKSNHNAIFTAETQVSQQSQAPASDGALHSRARTPQGTFAALPDRPSQRLPLVWS